MSEKLPKLAAFVRSLENIGFNFNFNKFDDRLRLQKFVYLAKGFGFDPGYSYNLYIHGPYSPELADDYYQLGEDLSGEEIDLASEFFDLVENKTERWLEFAATFVMITKKNSGVSDEDKIKLVLRNKPWANREELESVLNELKKYKLIN